MTGVKIHQIYYRRRQKRYLDPGFSPWNNRSNRRPEWAEFQVMIRAREDRERHFSDLTGFLSWKFRLKTGLESREVLDFISSNPGHDCYIFNPLTLQTALFTSVWEQGEHWHPGLKDRTVKLLEECGIETDFDRYVDTFASTAYCNFFVAGPAFWSAYFSLLEKVYTVLEQQHSKSSGPWQDTIHDSRPHKFVPFLIERCFGIVTRLNPGLKVLPYRYPGEKQAERTPGFGELIERADEEKNKCRDNRENPTFGEYLAIQREISRRLHSCPDAEKLLLR